MTGFPALCAQRLVLTGNVSRCVASGVSIRFPRAKRGSRPNATKSTMSASIRTVPARHPDLHPVTGRTGDIPTLGCQVRCGPVVGHFPGVPAGAAAKQEAALPDLVARGDLLRGLDRVALPQRRDAGADPQPGWWPPPPRSAARTGPWRRVVLFSADRRPAATGTGAGAGCGRVREPGRTRSPAPPALAPARRAPSNRRCRTLPRRRARVPPLGWTRPFAGGPGQIGGGEGRRQKPRRGKGLTVSV